MYSGDPPQGNVPKEEPGPGKQKGMATCLKCGCYEPFQDMTEECCRATNGSSCVFHLPEKHFTKLEVLATGNTHHDLVAACVDCGRLTGCFCDGEELRTSRLPCLASSHYPETNQKWAAGQRTPLCTSCDRKFSGQCHFCRGVAMATPPPTK